MRILISVDFEGASGIVSEKQTGFPKRLYSDPEQSEGYLEGRRWLTGDVNAAVEGAREAGATSFVMHDSHGLDYRNVLLEELDPAVEAVRGQPVIFYETDLVDKSFDAAFLIAMHARAGQPGIISHVLSWPLIQGVRINGRPVGESEITAALAGSQGIPTVLITGDDLVCAEMQVATNQQIETAVVKYSLSRYAARCLPLSAARERIRQAACRAVERIREIRPFGYEPPISIAVDWRERQVASYVSWIPQVTYDGVCTTTFTAVDFLSVYKALLAMFWVAGSGSTP